MISTPAGTPKMSEVFWDFVDPYLGHTKSEADLRNLLNLGMAAWNLPLSPEDKRPAFIRKLPELVPEDAQADTASILAEMIRRKETQFADNKRFIVSYELTMTRTGPHLSVMSTFPEEG